MRNKIKIIPLLLISPLLLMANSPAPYAVATAYEDFEVTSITYEEITGSGYLATFTIYNSGDCYFDVGGFYALTEESYVYLDAIDYGTCIPPKQTLAFTSNQYLTKEYEISDYQFYGYAYTTCDEISYSSFSFVDYEYRENYYNYYFKLEGVKTIDDGYYYSYIYDITIKDVNYAFERDYNNVTLSLSLKELYSQEDFSLNKIYAVRGREKMDYYSINSMWLTIWLLLALFIGLSVIIFPAFIPLIVKSSIKRNKKENNG